MNVVFYCFSYIFIYHLHFYNKYQIYFYEINLLVMIKNDSSYLSILIIVQTRHSLIMYDVYVYFISLYMLCGNQKKIIVQNLY